MTGLMLIYELDLCKYQFTSSLWSSGARADVGAA
jgi:hypothetical protein